MNPLLLIKPLLGLGGGLLNNPVAKLIANKTVGAISHKLEKDKIIKAKDYIVGAKHYLRAELEKTDGILHKSKGDRSGCKSGRSKDWCSNGTGETNC